MTRSNGVRINLTRAERDAATARRVQSRRLYRHLLTDGERTYSAYSANELLEIESQADRARPGHPLG